MNKGLHFRFNSSQTVDFIVDDDPQFTLLSKQGLSKYQRFIVLCDESVDRLWYLKIKHRLSKYQKGIIKIVIPAGESQKDIMAYVKHVKKLIKLGLTRFDLIIAIGGGVVQDLTSFIASTYMRGVPFFSIPTTLVAQVDAITAGKTCINAEGYKNIIGTFYFPFLAYININFLSTNRLIFLRQGFSEIFKYGLLGSKKLLRYLEVYSETRGSKNNRMLMKIILETIRVRVSIRKKHPLASNLGHTFGQAIEKITGYKVKHGDAITAGTVMALHFALQEGIITERLVKKIVSSMERLGLKTRLNVVLSPEEMLETMLRDKKSSSDEINLVLIRNIEVPYQDEKGYFYSVRPDKMRRFLKKYLKQKV